MVIDTGYRTLIVLAGIAFLATGAIKDGYLPAISDRLVWAGMVVAFSSVVVAELGLVPFSPLVDILRPNWDREKAISVKTLLFSYPVSAARLDMYTKPLPLLRSTYLIVTAAYSSLPDSPASHG
ncbi:hypothetical protein BKA82DRAFT_836434 [Pisolithus tinctorius]|uniref:Uncharacterized protein n=1 Tax=Pisolithus tinctorius Marx 270 TaxID=870435 RepID=A0A0C3KNL1_PISTI|nr:hypothetical protein BKA82DRAFT_836434 [Pisolithus tinctorius]KIO11197.1 hypothetical protein M404DRAFT_836434 [Pisolithus tinctorius Marx 270]